MVKPIKECKETQKIENENMSITHNIHDCFIIMASNLNTSRATEIIYTILELANIELSNGTMEKIICGPISLYLDVLYNHSSQWLKIK